MEQTIYKSGSSLVVVVPSDFIEAVGAKNGDKVKVEINYDEGVVQYYFSGSKQLRLPTLTNQKQIHGKTD